MHDASSARRFGSLAAEGPRRPLRITVQGQRIEGSALEIAGLQVLGHPEGRSAEEYFPEESIRVSEDGLGPQWRWRHVVGEPR